MHILVVHRYYWPDTSPYATLLRSIVGRWTQDGHQVEVLSAIPSYKSTAQVGRYLREDLVDEVLVHRLHLPHETYSPLTRIFNAIRLTGALIWKSISKRFDVIMISTTPPVLGGVAAAFASKFIGARFIYHCMDIHPEAGAISGEFSHPFIFSLLRNLDTWSCQKADPVVVLSKDMVNTLQIRPAGQYLKIKVINNFSLHSPNPIPKDLPFPWPKDCFTALFAGNIGRFQGLETVIEAMKLLRDRDDIEFVMMGEGSMKGELQRKSTELGLRIRFIDHQPVEVAKGAMRQASVGYVSLSSGVYKYAYPSKTMTYLEQGCPLLVSVESMSCLAQDIEGGGYGVVVAPGDSMDLATKLRWMADNEVDVGSMREMAALHADALFSEHRSLEEWSSLMNQFE